ncbi:hypothetical protein PIROE2DRAFT_9660, partial [Piromyces sp. E2]
LHLFKNDKKEDKKERKKKGKKNLNDDERVIKIKPTLDIVFKRLFGYEINKEILVHFLNSILKYYGNFNFAISNVRFLDKELMVEDINEKFPRVDILVTQNTEEKVEELVNIEIQVSNKGNMYNRSEFYASRLMSHSVLKGQQYEDIPEIILINILDYNMFKDKIGYRYFPRNEVAFYKGKFYHSVNGKLFDEEMNVLKDKKGNKITLDTDKCNRKLSTIHFIELPKFKVNNKNDKNNNKDDDNNNEVNDENDKNDEKDEKDETDETDSNYEIDSNEENEENDNNDETDETDNNNENDENDENNNNENNNDENNNDENNNDENNNDENNNDENNNDNDINDESIKLWIKFLNNPNDQLFRNENTKNVFKKARSQLLLLQDDDNFKQEYNRRINSLIIENSTRISERRKGEKKGIKKGEKKGIKKGEKRGKRKGVIEVAFQCCEEKFDLPMIKKLTKLSEKEIKIIDKFLKESESDRDVDNLAKELKINSQYINEICNSLKRSYDDSDENGKDKKRKKRKTQ